MSGLGGCRNEPIALFAETDEAEQDQLMRTIDQAACAIVKATASDVFSQHSKCVKDERRLRVPQTDVDDGDDGFFAGNTQDRGAATLDHTVTDMELTALPATQKRTKDEVDVAAAGIFLEVRRFQCTKSTLALQEATKNDATPQSSKLVHYLVSATQSSDGLCTEKEMCEWLVAQMCDRLETGQVWVMAKTYGLLSALLWRGSGSFVTAVHDYGAAMFQASHVVSLMKSTPQQNLSGERLPCQLQPIESASAGQKSAGGKAKPCGACPFEVMKRKLNGNTAGSKSGGKGEPGVPEGDLSMLVSNVAYLESLCEYRMRHPTLDLAHGEILMVDPSDSATRADPAAADLVKKTYSPTAWKELLDDTLELMKAIASSSPQGPVCQLGRAAATMRLREAVLLYQVACRALVRLLHAVLTASRTFVASIQAGLQVQSSNLIQGGAAAKVDPTASSTNFLGVAFDPNALDYSLSPDVVHGFVHEYYYAIYQFNRTVNMLRSYCASAEHLEKETTVRALNAFKVLPEASILEVKDSMRKMEIPMCATTLERLFGAARTAAAAMSESNNPASTSSELNLSASNVSPKTPPCSPLSDKEVRDCMLAMRRLYGENHEHKNAMWKHQVDAVCSLFDENETNVLRQIFSAGVEGLRMQWQEFTNNGAAAAEKALMTSCSFSSKRTGSSTTPGLSSSDVGASGDRSSGRQDSGADALTKSSTYILRSLPFSVRTPGSPAAKSDIISLSRSMDSSTESAIDALLQEDDVVVICNEECSSNDTMKLVDRFQVLMDVPLGEGSYGQVYRAWDEVIGCYLAAKELPLDASKAHNVAVREVLQEYTVLTELSHPNIVRVVAFMVLKRTARIYMEWVPSGSLQDVLRHHPRGMLRESVVRRYARDVLSGLAFLHSRGVIHRDVKPGNMLLSSEGAVKLTDFGTSLVLSGNHHTFQSDVVTGTAAYMAPECVQGTYSSASDIWSFGCSVVQLIAGGVPWCSPATDSTTEFTPEPIALLFKVGSLDDSTHLERPHDALKAAAKAAKAASDLEASLNSTASSAAASAKEKPRAKDGVSAELLDMLDAIFVVDRKKRPSASELLQHPFFKME